MRNESITLSPVATDAGTKWRVAVSRDWLEALFLLSLLDGELFDSVEEAVEEIASAVAFDCGSLGVRH